METLQTSALLIIHADDVGLCKSVNTASFTALAQGFVTSGSIMVPCSSFAQAARLARSHPEWDLGVHITLTSEWQYHRWGPVANRREVSSLIDSSGYFYRDLHSFASAAEPSEVKIEMRAQIEAAIGAGLHPTHLDCHMYAVAAAPLLYRAFVEVASEYRLPYIALNSAATSSESEQNTGAHWVIGTTPATLMINAAVRPDQWSDFYTDAVASASNGIYQLTVHLGLDEPELQAITAGHYAWNAAWRQRDLAVLSSKEFRGLLRQRGVRLVGWRQLAHNGLIPAI